MASIAELLVFIKTIGAKKASTDIKSVEKAGGSAEKQTQNLVRATNDLAKAYGRLRNAASVYVALNVVKSIARTGLEFDRMNRALVSATGSTQSAKEEMGFLRDEADRIGVSILSVGKSYSQLSAAAKGTNISQNQVRDVFTAVSEAAVVLGLSADDTKGSFRALVQVMSKGKVQAEELRGQIGERFPGAFQAAARSMGKTTEELSDMLEKGLLLSDEFIPKFTAEIRRTYEQAVPEALGSAQAAFGRFETAMANAQNELAQGGFLDALAVSATTATTATNELIKSIKVAAEWTAALSMDQISMWEYVAGGAKSYFKLLNETPVIKDTFLGAAAGWLYDLGEGTDEVTEKLKKLAIAMEGDQAGKRFKIGTPPSVQAEIDKNTKSPSELRAEAAAKKKSRTAFDNLVESMLREEEVIEKSYKTRTSIIIANTGKESTARKNLLSRSKEIYDQERSAFEDSKTEEINTLTETMMTQEEIIRDSHKRRLDIINKSKFDSPEEKDTLTSRVNDDFQKQLDALKESKNSEFNTIRESLRTEEEVILASYEARRTTILENTEATATEKADLLARLNKDFATDALGELSKPDTYEEQVAAIEDFYSRRHELIMSNTQITEEQRTALELELTRNRIEQLEQLESARTQQILSGAADTFGGLAELAKTFKGEQSKEYKAMFAASQAFEIAQAIMKTYDSATGAYSSLSSIPYVGPALGAAAATAAIGAGMANVAQIRSQSYSGAYDAGGYIPGGSVGLVGEVGPELVSGPANVTSRKDTAALLNKEQPPQPPPVNNIRIVNAFDSEVVGDYIGSDAGEKAILNVVKRNQGTIQQMMG